MLNYTGGGQGTQAVGMAKPIGGNVVDIENVPLDQVNHYLENGYYQLDTTGTQQFTGYCMSQPIDEAHPTGSLCSPATVTPVLFVRPQAITQAPATPQQLPRELPHVGAGGYILFAMIIAIITTILFETIGKRRSL